MADGELYAGCYKKKLQICAVMYKLLRSFLFLFSPEWVHYFSMNCLRLLCGVGFIRNTISSIFKPAQRNTLFTTAHGTLEFKNPVGLGAGFDKNARYLRELECLGFGFVEVGTVTPKPQAGNEKPRLFRLPADRALINRMGFNNDGAEVVANRLKDWQSKQAAGNVGRLIVGGNIGKNKSTPNEDAWKDYEICFKALFDYVDYFVVNVSSPNTPGLRALQDKDSLRQILSNLQHINFKKERRKPILLKIAPDLTQEQVDDVIDLAMEIQLDGIVATNTTISREGLKTAGTQIEKIGAGGLSGKPVTERSTAIVQQIVSKTNGKIPVIASGGIFTSEDAAAKMNRGAVLIQVWTGFIYEGPAIVKKICKGLSGK